MVVAAGEQLSEATEPQSKQRTEVSVTEECQDTLVEKARRGPAQEND